MSAPLTALAVAFVRTWTWIYTRGTPGFVRLAFGLGVSLLAVGIFLVVAAIILRRRARQVRPQEEPGEFEVETPLAAGAPAARAR